MKNNYYNKRFLFEELDIEEQRDKLEQIIVLQLNIFDKLAKQMNKYPEFKDNDNMINIGKFKPEYRLNIHHLKGSSDIDSIHEYVNKYDEILFQCNFYAISRKYTGFYDYDKFETFLDYQAEKNNKLELITKDISNFAKKIRQQYGFDGWRDNNFKIEMTYKFNKDYYVHIMYRFKPVYIESKIFNLEKEYSKIIKYAKELYSIGKEMLQQYHNVFENGWNNILNKAKKINYQLYYFLAYDFVEDWNNYWK